MPRRSTPESEQGSLASFDAADVLPEAFPGDDESKAGTLVIEFFADKPSAYLSMTRAEMSAHIARTLQSGKALYLHRPHHAHGAAGVGGSAEAHVHHAAGAHKQDRKEFALHSRDLRKVCRERKRELERERERVGERERE